MTVRAAGVAADGEFGEFGEQVIVDPAQLEVAHGDPQPRRGPQPRESISAIVPIWGMSARPTTTSPAFLRMPRTRRPQSPWISGGATPARG
ncbi:MAG: hypothetical protein QM677_02815 [Microbacterium sp.]